VPASLKELLPFPKAGPRKATRGRRRQKSRILTDIPVREELRQQQECKKAGKNKAKKRLNLGVTEEVVKARSTSNKCVGKRPGKRPLVPSRDPRYHVNRPGLSNTTENDHTPIEDAIQPTPIKVTLQQ